MLGCLAGPAPVGERLALLPYSAAAAAGFEPDRCTQEVQTPPQRPRQKTPAAHSPELQLPPPGSHVLQPLSQPPPAQMLEALPIPPPPPATERPPAIGSSDATSNNKLLQAAAVVPGALSAPRPTPPVQTVPVGAPALAQKFLVKSGCGLPPFKMPPGGSTPPPGNAAAAATIAKVAQRKSPPTAAAAAISTPVRQETAPAAGSGPYGRITYYNTTIASTRIADQTE